MIGITGATGFIGTAVKQALGSADITEIDLRQCSDEELSQILANCSTLIHLASPLPNGDNDIEEEIIKMAERIAKVAIDIPKLGIIFASTIRMYPSKADPIDWEVGTGAWDPYGRGKAASEAILASLENGKRRIDFLRIASVQGRENNGMQRGVCGFFARQAKQGNLQVMGEGTAMKDLIHVNDVANAIVAATKAEAVGVHIHGIGANPISVIDLAKIYSEKCGVGISFVEANPFELSAYFAIDLFGSDLGWRPEIGLEEIVELSLQE